jgi:hypothetical protein
MRFWAASSDFWKKQRQTAQGPHIAERQNPPEITSKPVPNRFPTTSAKEHCKNLKKIFTSIGRKPDLKKLDKFIVVEGNSMYQRKKRQRIFRVPILSVLSC